ncbi:MAG: rhodanese-like domain-containing protein [Bacteroidota bacterium]
MNGKLKLFMLVMALLGQFSCGDGKGNGLSEKIDKTTLEQMAIGQDVQLIDVRTPEEYNLGYIGDAINFDINNQEQFLEQIASLDKEEPVYLYCKMGGRSNRAAELMKEKGFKKIYDYSGGYQDWISE